ncbi:transporter [Photobacterium aquimaris]|uniref:Transporter n=2 Tax=Photobacterium TaxID=657 RepID=A0A2T3IR05_9GAMM|nr:MULTISPECIES: PACE efflux transporter [Photobacterium]OBU16868.1 transporter [Photobacterium aquimaris]OBU21783.1 transporter [Photobacterium aquimaris]PSU30781.1 transporter [Photobacterium aquimaris]PSW00040.1 transporter [Photobacterium aquimaris]SMY34073.1 Bacterial Transmembrane Pair family protein [Photobacterium andalusiense]
MRTRLDRIRHAVCFEVIGLILLVGVLSQLGFDGSHVGVVGIAFSILATGWNYIYNIWFDRMLYRRYKTAVKTTAIRIVHSLGFEAGLLVVTIPILSWVLKVTLWEAFVLDIGMVLFYLIYAYVYNIAYDRLFPIPAVQQD